jgi:hypothetical protein
MEYLYHITFAYSPCTGVVVSSEGGDHYQERTHLQHQHTLISIECQILYENSDCEMLMHVDMTF